MKESNPIERRDKGKTDEDKLKNFFLQEKPADMIVILHRQGTSYASELSSKADTTYSHSVKVMNRMKDIGLVESERKGRKKEYRLTEKGKKLAENLTSMFEEVDGMDVEKGSSDKKWGLDAVRRAKK